EPFGQRMYRGRGQRHALGEATRPTDLGTVAHALLSTLRTIATSPARLARDSSADQRFRDARTHIDDRAGVLVSHDEWRAPREETLSRMHIRTADTGGAHLDQDLSRGRNRFRNIVDTEVTTALPCRHLHAILLFVDQRAPKPLIRVIAQLMFAGKSCETVSRFGGRLVILPRRRRSSTARSMSTLAIGLALASAACVTSPGGPLT